MHVPDWQVTVWAHLLPSLQPDPSGWGKTSRVSHEVASRVSHEVYLFIYCYSLHRTLEIHGAANTRQHCSIK